MAVQRNQFPNEVRGRLVRSFEDPTEDCLIVADALGVNRSTARGILMYFPLVFVKSYTHGLKKM